MYLRSGYIVYPEGDIQEIEHELRFNQMVDLNGFPLTPPLMSSKIIAYRVYKITRKENKGSNDNYYHLELIPAKELETYTI